MILPCLRALLDCANRPAAAAPMCALPQCVPLRLGPLLTKSWLCLFVCTPHQFPLAEFVHAFLSSFCVKSACPPTLAIGMNHHHVSIMA